MAGSRGNHETRIRIGGEVLPSFGRAMGAASGELEGLYQRARRENAGFMAGVDSLDKLADKTFSMVGKAAKVTAAGIAGVVTASTVAGAGYEQQMSMVQAISGASASDMERLDKLAQEMGRNTKFSAKEAGEGLEYMAAAGWGVDQMIAGLPGILNLAAGSGEDLGEVSNIVTDSLTAFGMKAEEAAHFADVLAEASNASNTNVSLMGETFQYVAPVAGALGFTVEDTAVAIGLMANAGIKGSQAGTSLRAMMSRMAKPTKETREAMNLLGVSLTNADGSMKSFRDIMVDLREGMSGLSEAQQASTAAALAGQEAMSGLLAIANASPEDFDSLAASIDNSTGAAQRMADILMDNLMGDLTLLESAAEGAAIGLYDVVGGLIREGAQEASVLVNEFTESDFLKGLTEDMPNVRREIKQFGRAAEDFLEPLLDVGKWFLKHPDVIAGSIAGIGGALLTFKSIKGLTNLATVFGSLAGMVSSWPVAVTGLAIGGILGIAAAIKTAERQATQANLAEHFGDIVLSVEELDEAARNVFGEGFLNNLDAFRDARESSDALKESLDDGLREIQKENWKMNVGIEFDEDDKEGYRVKVDEYVKNAQDYVSNRGYEIQLAVGLVFGDDSQEGAAMKESSSQFYKALDEEVKRLSGELTEVLNTELNDSFTITDKQEKAAQLLNDIADITDMVTASRNQARIQLIGDKYSGADLLDPETFQNLQQEVTEYSEESLESLDDAYEQTLASLNAQLDLGKQGKEGGISQEEFDQSRLDALEAYNNQRAQVLLDAYNLTKDTIADTYGLNPMLEEAQKNFNEKLTAITAEADTMTPDTYVAELYNAWQSALEESEIDKTTQAAVGKLLEGLVPTQEQMAELSAQITAAGGKVPEELTKAMMDSETIGAAGGSISDVWGTIGQIVSESPEAMAALNAMQEKGQELPEYFANALNENTYLVTDASQALLSAAKTTLEGGISARIPIYASLEIGNQTGEKPERHAAGGLITQPTLSYFAEESPEMAIPIDHSRRAVSLWEETGRLLGVYQQNNYSRTYESMAAGSAVVSEQSGGNVMAPVYAPVMNFYGNTTREDIEAAGMTKYEQFKEWIERYQYEQARVAF